MILTDRKKKIFKEALVLAALIALFSTQAIAQGEDLTHEERRAAFDACLTELGIERPEPGQRPQAPDDNVREQIDSCMKAKGFEPPKHRRGGPDGGHPGNSSGGGVQ